MSEPNEDVLYVERWIHAPHHKRETTPSYWRFNEWLNWQCGEFGVEIDRHCKDDANFVLMEIVNGIQAFAEANMFDLPLGDSSHVHAVEVIWRVDISSDGGDTYEEFAQWSQDRYDNAEQLARGRARAAQLDGHDVKIYRIKRVKFDRIEVKK